MERNHSYAIYVVPLLLETALWRDSQPQFMKERSIFIVSFVVLLLLTNVIFWWYVHIASVHELERDHTNATFVLPTLLIKDLWTRIFPKCMMEITHLNVTFALPTSQENSIWKYTYLDSVHEGNNPFNCDICNATLHKKHSLKEHAASVHDAKKPFNCKIYSATFIKQRNLKKHSATIHEVKKQFDCEICSANFKIHLKNSFRNNSWREKATSMWHL